MYENFERIISEKGLRPYDVCKATSISSATMSDWKKGRSTPKLDKLQKIADFLEVSLECLTTGKSAPKVSMTGKKWYFDDATAEMAQDLFTNPNQRILFSASRGARPEDLQMAADLLQRLKGVHGDEQ